MCKCKNCRMVALRALTLLDPALTHANIRELETWYAQHPLQPCVRLPLGSVEVRPVVRLDKP